MTKAEQRLEAERLLHKAMDLEEAGKIKEAIKLYTASARLGDCGAQSNLGNLLDRADPPRPAQAVYWYKRAVRTGFSVAAWNLAMHYRNLGMPRWHKHWLQKAAAMGDEEAVADLKKLKRPAPRAKNSRRA